MTYVVYNYPPNGHRAEDFCEERREFRTLDDARKEVKRRLGELDRLYRWSGFESCPGMIEVEAYHESDRQGSGGAQISMRIKSIQPVITPAP